MANEWVCLTNPTSFGTGTVADANALTKGTLMVIGSDPNTIVAATGTVADIPVGVCMQDKVANDGTTSVSVALNGDWDVIANGSIALGELVIPGAVANYVVTAPISGSLSNIGFSRILGKCLETASNLEQVRIRLML
jgi:hypothetical protein